MADPLDILYGRQSQGGDDWGGTLANLAQMIASIPERRARAAMQRAELENQQANTEISAGNLQLAQQQQAQQQAAAQRIAQMDQAVNGIVKEAFVDGPDGTKRLDRARLSKGFAEQGIPLDVQKKTFDSLDAVDDSLSKFEKARMEHAADVLNAVLENGGGADAAMLGIAYGKANGWLKDSDIEPIYRLLASDQDPRPVIKQIRDSLSDKYRPKPKDPVKLGPNDVLVPAEGGAPIASNPVAPKPENAPNVGSFEDYVLRKFGPNPTPAQITQARKEYNQADDRPPVNIRLPSGLTPAQALTQTRQLRNEYQREIKSVKTVNQQLAQMRSSLAAVRKGMSPAGSQGVLVTFQKILDPMSVVRESEYARSSSGLSLLGRIEGAWEKIKNGGAGVTVKDLEQFVALAEEFAKNLNAFAAQSKAQIDALAKEYGLKPDLITSDPSEVNAPPPKRTTNPYPK